LKYKISMSNNWWRRT